MTSFEITLEVHLQPVKTTVYIDAETLEKAKQEAIKSIADDREYTACVAVEIALIEVFSAVEEGSKP